MVLCTRLTDIKHTPCIMSQSSIHTAQSYVVKELANYADGATVSKILTKNKNGSITYFAFDKGQNLSEHTAPFDATVLIIEGSSKITVGSKEHLLKEGEMIIMPANIPHALEAVKPFKMMLIMIRP